MPLYDYRCTECGREVEVMHGIYASGPEACESCGGAMRKALSTPAIHFKGSGWAKKDAAAASAKKAKPKGSASPDSAKPDETKGDGAKPETADKAVSKAEGPATSTSGTTAATGPKAD